jgi:hypothetical protein
MGANQAKEAELDDKGNGQREYTAADSTYRTTTPSLLTLL